MNILCLSYEYPPLGGGGSVVCHGLANSLVKLGHRVDVVTSHFKDLAWFEEQGGVKIHRVKCTRRNPWCTNTLELMTLLRPMYSKALELMSQHYYDINHTHFVIPTGVVSYWLYRKTGLPYIITAHGSDIPGFNPNRFKFEHKLLTWYWRRIVLHSQMIISPSNFLKSLILQKIDVPITVINNGFTPSENHSSPIAKKNIVLVVTRMFERKGVQYLLEAIRNMKIDSLQKLQKAMETEEYGRMTAEIQRYVFNYCSRILKPTGRVKTDKYTIQLRVWKFNQYFNIIPGKEKEYTEIITKDHLPTMEKLGVKMTGGWQVVVGPSPYIVAEGTARNIIDIAKALESDEYKRITKTLTSKYVTDYSSRVLAPTGRIELPYLLGKMMKGF